MFNSIKKFGSAFVGFFSGLISLVMILPLLRHVPFLLSDGFKYTREKLRTNSTILNVISIIPSFFASLISTVTRLIIVPPIHGATSGFKKGFLEGILSSWRIAVTKKFPSLTTVKEQAPLLAPQAMHSNTGSFDNEIKRIGRVSSDSTIATALQKQGDRATTTMENHINNGTNDDFLIARILQEDNSAPAITQPAALRNHINNDSTNNDFLIATILQGEGAPVIAQNAATSRTAFDTELELAIALSLSEQAPAREPVPAKEAVIPVLHGQGIQDLLGKSQGNGSELKANQILPQTQRADEMLTTARFFPRVSDDVTPTDYDNEIKRSAAFYDCTHLSRGGKAYDGCPPAEQNIRIQAALRDQSLSSELRSELEAEKDRIKTKLSPISNSAAKRFPQ